VVKVLLDTCVLSELRRPQANPAVRAAVDGLDDRHIFLSVITLGEVAKGIALLPAGERKQQLDSWLAGIEQRYADQILPVDSEIAHIWGDIMARAQGIGIQVPATDGLIAATAMRHGLEVMTRNTRHFVATGALIIDPWANTPRSPDDNPF